MRIDRRLELFIALLTASAWRSPSLSVQGRAAPGPAASSSSTGRAHTAAPAARVVLRLRRWRPFLRGNYLLSITRIHGFGTATGCFLNHVVSLGIEFGVWIGARQPMGNPSLVMVEFRHNLTWVVGNVLSGRPSEVRAAHHGFGQIDGIINDDGPREVFTVPPEVLRQFSQIAARYAVSTDPSLLQMSRPNFQNLAYPFTGGEALPGMWSQFIRMRPSIHVDPAFRRLPHYVSAPGNQLPGYGIDLFPDLKVCGSARRIIRRVRLALMFRNGKNIGVPGIGHCSSGVVDGKSGVISKLRPGEPLGLIFVILRSPFSGKIDLCKRRNACHSDPEQARQP